MQRILGFYYFIFFFAMAATSPFLSLYLSEKGMGSTQIGLLLAAGSAAGFLAQPILGLVSDRARDPRRILFYSAILAPILYSGYAVFRGFWPLFIIAIVGAIVQSASPIADAITVQTAERSQLFTYGQIRLWGALSFAIAAVIAGYVYHIIGIGASFVVYGVLSILIVWTTLYLPKTESLSQTREHLLTGIWNVARQGRLMVFIFICFLVSVCVSANFSFLPLYYEHLHYPMGWVGLNFTVAALIEVPFFYISGKVMARFGLMSITIVATMLYTLKYAIMAFAPGAPVVIAVQVLDGIAYALFWSACVQLLSELAPSNRQSTAQTLNGAIAGSLSNIVGNSCGGWVFQHFGPLSMYGSIAVLSAISVLCFVFFARFGLRTKGARRATSVEQASVWE